MRGLVVGDGEGGAGAGVQGVQAVFVADGQVAEIAQVAVDEDRGVVLTRGLDAVLADDHHLRAGGAEVIDHLADDGVELDDLVLDVGVVRAQALQAVVEVGQVGQGERRAKAVVGVQRGVGDPAGGGEPGQRAPEVEQREAA